MRRCSGVGQPCVDGTAQRHYARDFGQCPSCGGIQSTHPDDQRTMLDHYLVAE